MGTSVPVPATPRTPPLPSTPSWPGCPHLPSGGRAMMRGREVSTTSPLLASTRMFWIMFSSSASCRLAKAGILQGGQRVGISRVTRHSHNLLLASCALAGFSLISPPSPHLIPSLLTLQEPKLPNVMLLAQKWIRTLAIVVPISLPGLRKGIQQ